jgi:hypothetical protein
LWRFAAGLAPSTDVLAMYEATLNRFWHQFAKIVEIRLQKLCKDFPRESEVFQPSLKRFQGGSTGKDTCLMRTDLDLILVLNDSTPLDLNYKVQPPPVVLRGKRSYPGFPFEAQCCHQAEYR